VLSESLCEAQTCGVSQIRLCRETGCIFLDLPQATDSTFFFCLDPSRGSCLSSENLLPLQNALGDREHVPKALSHLH
jgi:hypothetical protein